MGSDLCISFYYNDISGKAKPISNEVCIVELFLALLEQFVAIPVKNGVRPPYFFLLQRYR
ncbi:hypothetical protein FACS1894164_09950 [Spirochaetia bacterium]|nr:hypothetical protein FACS1894164_09950 [Spirochaetia bacterium]